MTTPGLTEAGNLANACRRRSFFLLKKRKSNQMIKERKTNHKKWGLESNQSEERPSFNR